MVTVTLTRHPAPWPHLTHELANAISCPLAGTPLLYASVCWAHLSLVKGSPARGLAATRAVDKAWRSLDLHPAVMAPARHTPTRQGRLTPTLRHYFLVASGLAAPEQTPLMLEGSRSALLQSLASVQLPTTRRRGLARRASTRPSAPPICAPQGLRCLNVRETKHPLCCACRCSLRQTSFGSLLSARRAPARLPSGCFYAPAAHAGRTGVTGLDHWCCFLVPPACLARHTPTAQLGGVRRRATTHK